MHDVWYIHTSIALSMMCARGKKEKWTSSGFSGCCCSYTGGSDASHHAAFMSHKRVQIGIL